MVQKPKFFCSKWSLIQRLIWICRIKWWCSFYLFYTRNTLFGQIWSKKSKLSVWPENWYKDNLNMKNSMSMFIFPVFDWKYLFWKFVPYRKILYWSYNLEPRLIRICRIRCWFSFCLDRKYPFWVNLVQKFKRVSLRQNLVFIIC